VEATDNARSHETSAPASFRTRRLFIVTKRARHWSLSWPGRIYGVFLQVLALTSPTSGGRSIGIVRSWTEATEFSFRLVNIPSSSEEQQRTCKYLMYLRSVLLTVSSIRSFDLQHGLGSSRLPRDYGSHITLNNTWCGPLSPLLHTLFSLMIADMSHRFDITLCNVHLRRPPGVRCFADWFISIPDNSALPRLIFETASNKKADS
jgi:hypothetical protein